MLDAAFLLDICWVSWIFGFIAFIFLKNFIYYLFRCFFFFYPLLFSLSTIAVPCTCRLSHVFSQLSDTMSIFKIILSLCFFLIDFYSNVFKFIHLILHNIWFVVISTRFGSSQVIQWSRIYLPMQEMQETQVWSMSWKDLLE